MSAHSLLFLGYELEMNVNTDFRRPTTPYYDRDYVFTIGNKVATLESYNRLRQRVTESGVGSAAVAAAVTPAGWTKVQDRSVAMLAVRSKSARLSDDPLAGFARLEEHEGGVAVFCDGMVDPDSQRLGLFHEMLRRGIDFAQSTQYKRVILSAEPGLEGLYTEVGFKTMPDSETDNLPRSIGGVLLDVTEVSLPGPSLRLEARTAL